MEGGQGPAEAPTHLRGRQPLAQGARERRDRLVPKGRARASR